MVTAVHAVAPIPSDIDFAAAATAPVAYLTVVYALGRVARLSPGERILIHGGAGGVGLAAIQYARHRGAEIFVTAGSEVKREFLRQLGADHVLDSRSLAFADEIRLLTGGEGVDVVLNSLSGEAMERSLGLLKPFGRFLELGKRDFFMNTRVGLRPLRQNVAYFAIDADRLPRQKPELAAELMAETVALMRGGALRPLPHRVFGFGAALDAFRLMQSAGHIGKIVLVPEPASAWPAARPRPFVVRPDATYLVVGGLTGFGLETARWLVGRGARHLALVGRRGLETPGAADAVAALTAAGVKVHVFACDAADEAALGGVLAFIRRAAPPLKGVVHAAMVVDDGLTADLTAARLQAVIAPKLGGACALDELTRGDALDFMLLYSSATTLLGAPGQGSYVAANLALEGLAAARCAEGLPTLAVGWGPIADAGYLARQEETREALARRLAAQPLAAAEALAALPALWASGLPTVAYAKVQWETARRRLPILAFPAFSELADAAGDVAETNLADRLRGLPDAEAKALTLSLLVEEVARILSAAPDRIDAQRPLSELGMDSLMAVELRLSLEKRFGVNLPLLSLADSTNLNGVAARVVKSLSDEAPSGAVAEAAHLHEADTAAAPAASITAAE